MSGIEDGLQGDPTERMVMNVTNKATLECSRFCLTNCGLYGEAQLQVVTMGAMVSNKPVACDFRGENPEVRMSDENGVRMPEFKMSCAGPRKKYWIAGELVCRKKAKIEKA